MQICGVFNFKSSVHTEDLIKVVDDVEQTVVLLASPCSCNAPHPAKTDHLIGEGRSFVSQKGPSAYFKSLKTKQICSCLSEMQLLSIDGAVQVGRDFWRSYIPYKAGLMAEGLVCFWHSREHSLHGWRIPGTGDCNWAAREMWPL